MSNFETFRSYAFKIIRLLAGATLLVFSLWGVNWRQLASSVGSITVLWFLFALGSVVVGLGLKAVRWWLFLPELNHYFLRLFARAEYIYA